MKILRIKTFFHIIGAACLIFGGLIILIALDQNDETSLIALAIGGVLLPISFYCLAGAPQLTKIIRRRFPNLETLQNRKSHPRHKAKAILGITAGLLVGVAPFFIGSFDFLPKNITASLSDFVPLMMLFAPIASAWGTAHWSWHKGSSPKTPLLVAGVCFLLLSPLGFTGNIAIIMAGFILIIIAPPITAILTSRSRQRKTSR